MTATTGSQTITTTYDRLGRPLTVDDEDTGTLADTTYTYSLTSPAWTDPTGSYTATLDRFDRTLAVNVRAVFVATQVRGARAMDRLLVRASARLSPARTKGAGRAGEMRCGWVCER